MLTQIGVCRKTVSKKQFQKLGRFHCGSKGKAAGLGVFHDLAHLRLGDFTWIYPCDSASALMDGQHHFHGLFRCSFKKPNEDFDHEFHRRVVVVMKKNHHFGRFFYFDGFFDGGSAGLFGLTGRHPFILLDKVGGERSEVKPRGEVLPEKTGQKNDSRNHDLTGRVIEGSACGVLPPRSFLRDGTRIRRQLDLAV